MPDSDLLVSLSEVLEAPVSTLLGESVAETEADGLKAIAEKDGEPAPAEEATPAEETPAAE